MSLLGDIIKMNKTKPLPTVTTILPAAAKQEIMTGRLPQLNNSQIFLHKGELIHYIDKAILLKEKVHKKHVGQNRGVSAPGLFKGQRVHWGTSNGEIIEETEIIPIKGILYITNQRIVFSAKNNGFDKRYRYLSTITPYSNAIELQYGSTTYSLLVSDGNVPYKTINLIREQL